MKNADALVIAAGLGFLTWVLLRDSSESDAEIPMGVKLSSEFEPYGDEDVSWAEPESWDMTDLFTASEEQKVYAFLYMLRFCEHAAIDASNGEAYRTFYGGSRFVDQSDHPVLTGEKVGVKLSDAMCKHAGLAPGCVSTAAGAYQIIKPTWNRVREAGRWGPRLDDFGNASQDEAARRLLIESNILPLVLNGDIERAIYRASSVWASLPGNTYKQGSKPITFALARYQEGLSEASEFLA
jgi:lysozyme